MKNTFKKAIELLEEGDYESLNQLTFHKPEYFNWVQDVFEDLHVRTKSKATALLWTDGKETVAYSFLQMIENANQLLNFLRNNGIKQNDIVLTQMMLQPINWFCTLASIKGGLQLIPAAAILDSKDIAFRCEKTLPAVVISDQENAYKIEEAELITGNKIKIKIIAEGKRLGWYGLEDIAQESKEAQAAATKPDDTLFMFFTSGTTGMPKIVCHTHLSHPLGHLTTSSWIGMKEDDIHYNISQPGWAKFAWSSFFAPWNVGATIFAYHSLDRFDAKITLELMEQHKITTLCAPPTVLRLFIQENLKSYTFSLKQCVAAGEPLNPEVIEQWKEGTGILIRDGFGQTESTCMVANLPNMEIKYGSMGKPTFLHDIVIADDDGIILPINEEGNICVKETEDRLNGIFKGYLFDKERESQVFKNGLYYTGDKAYYDEDGYIWFVGRDDDVIKSSDYRIGPFEVESILLEHDAVLESAVVGSPHDLKGFEVKAFVVLNKGYASNEELADEIFLYCRTHIAPYKMPRLIEFVEDLPKTISGKIRRVELRSLEATRVAKGIKTENEFAYFRKK